MKKEFEKKKTLRLSRMLKEDVFCVLTVPKSNTHEKRNTLLFVDLAELRMRPFFQMCVYRKLTLLLLIGYSNSFACCLRMWKRSMSDRERERNALNLKLTHPVCVFIVTSSFSFFLLSTLSLVAFQRSNEKKKCTV